jgi:hypothetical protein
LAITTARLFYYKSPQTAGDLGSAITRAIVDDNNFLNRCRDIPKNVGYGFFFV